MATACGHDRRSEEHTSELQSRPQLVCRLLLEKKKSCTLMTSTWDTRRMRRRRITLVRNRSSRRPLSYPAPGTTRLPTGIFFFNDTATTEIYTLSLHDALPI